MNKIFVVSVFTDFSIIRDSRNPIWSFKFDVAKQLLDNFGCECRWSYACIEELGEGMHPQSFSRVWYHYADSKWNQIEYGIEPGHKHWNDMMDCVNIGIG